MRIALTYLILVVIWSTTPLAILWSTVDTSFAFSISSRMLIGAGFCWLILLLIKQKLVWNRQSVKTYVAASIGIFGAMSMVYWSSQYIPSGLIAVLFGLSPLFTVALEYFMLNKKHISPFKVIGIIVALAGLVFIFHSDLHSYQYAYKGILGLLFATFLHSLSAVLTKKYQAGIHPFTVTTGGLILSLPLFLLIWVIQDGSLPANVSTQAGVSILYLAIIATAIGFNLYFFALKETSASTLSLVTLVTPVTALILGAVFNHETIGMEVAIGSGLILFGLFINQHAEKLFRAEAKLTID